MQSACCLHSITVGHAARGCRPTGTAAAAKKTVLIHALAIGQGLGRPSYPCQYSQSSHCRHRGVRRYLRLPRQQLGRGWTDQMIVREVLMALYCWTDHSIGREVSMTVLLDRPNHRQGSADDTELLDRPNHL